MLNDPESYDDESVQMLNSELRNEELESLKEIYANEIVVERGEQGPNAEGWRGYVSIASSELHVKLPSTYPSRDCPVIEFRNMGKIELPALHQELIDLFVPGEIVLFTWIEHIREKITSEDSQDIVETSVQETSKVADSLFIGEYPEKVPEILSGDALTVRKSTFQAHLAKVSDPKQVKLVLDLLKQDKKILKATHNMYAYRIEREPGVFASDNDDDGENAAGSRLAHLLEIVGAVNVVVIVSRWYGGIQLGPSRFKLINNVARDILQSQGFI